MPLVVQLDHRCACRAPHTHIYVVVLDRDRRTTRGVSAMMKSVMAVLLAVSAAVAVGEDLGQLSANPYGSKSTANPNSPAGSPYSSTSVKNPNGQYGSPYSATSATNPYATDAPKLYDSQGNYRGKLSANPYDPESTSNPNGRYGSPHSADSINNPNGAGSKYRADSPNNPYGTGWAIKSDGDARATAPRSKSRSQSSESLPYTPPVSSYSKPPNSGYRAPTYGTRPATADPWNVQDDAADHAADSDPWSE